MRKTTAGTIERYYSLSHVNITLYLVITGCRKKKIAFTWFFCYSFQWGAGSICPKLKVRAHTETRKWL